MPNGNNDRNHPPLIGVIIEKIKRTGHVNLTSDEKALVVSIFRACAMTNERKVREIRDDIQRAHLYFCYHHLS